jgi:hypothetical protein
MLTPFVVTWVIGIVVTTAMFLATREQSWWVSTPLRTLALAVTFTPGIAAAGHGAMPAPAILVVRWGLGGSVRYFIDGGAIPIAIVWGILMCVWWVWAYIRSGD